MTKMSQAEKEAFLADVHVGVLGIPEPGRGPLTVPVWYDYTPGGEVWLVTGRTSLKGRLMSPGVAVSLCAQEENPPYKYVSVEGVVQRITEHDGEILPMAIRYLGEEMGRQYYESTSSQDNVVVHIAPRRWLAVDYGKA